MWGPSGAQLLAGGPKVLLTLSFSAIGRSCHVPSSVDYIWEKHWEDFLWHTDEEEELHILLVGWQYKYVRHNGHNHLEKNTFSSFDIREKYLLEWSINGGTWAPRIDGQGFSAQDCINHWKWFLVNFKYIFDSSNCLHSVDLMIIRFMKIISW